MKGCLVPATTGMGLFGDFRREMDGLVNQWLDSEGRSANVGGWTPRLNVAETEEAYEVTLDAPGMQADDFDIELHHGDLWISGERQVEAKKEGKTWHRVERSVGRFRRAVRLGDDVNPENVEAEYKDGVLSISISKSEAAKSKKITVKS